MRNAARQPARPGRQLRRRCQPRWKFKRPARRCRRPEHGETAAALSVFSSYAAVVMEQPEPVVHSSRVVRNQRSESAAPQETTVGSGTQGCRSVSVSHLLDDDDAPLGWDTEPWDGLPGETPPAPRWVGVPAGAPPATPSTPRPGWARSGTNRRVPAVQRPERSTPVIGQVSSGPGWSTRTTGRCPAAGGAASNSNRRTGPGTESCVKSAWSGPRCLRRATSNPQRQRSLLGTLGRANHPYGQPGQQGVVPPGFLWLETLENPDNTVIITGAGTEKDPLHHPPAIFPKLAARTAISTLCARPATAATVPGSGRATPTPGVCAF